MVDALVRDRTLTGSDLVISIQKLDTSLGVEDVLELTRYVNLQRILEDVRNVFDPHVSKYLQERGLTHEDVETVLKWYSPSSTFRPINSSPPWWRRILPCTMCTSETGREPSSG